MQKEVDEVSFLLFESRKEQTDSQGKNTQRERRADWIFTAWKQKLKQANKKRQKIIRGIDRYATVYSHGGDARMEKRLHWSHAWTFYTE